MTDRPATAAEELLCGGDAGLHCGDPGGEIGAERVSVKRCSLPVGRGDRGSLAVTRQPAETQHDELSKALREGRPGLGRRPPSQSGYPWR